MQQALKGDDLFEYSTVGSNFINIRVKHEANIRTFEQLNNDSWSQRIQFGLLKVNKVTLAPRSN